MKLDDVTLIAVTSVALNATVDALVASASSARFGAIRLLSDRRPHALPATVEWREIPALRSRQDYSRFILQDLHRHVDTPFALLVQWDGFVLDGQHWSKAFYDYDYIGAPWPQFDDGKTVGNGGFSLRSRRLLELTAQLPDNPDEAEDTFICRTHRELLEMRHGMRFAPEHVARQFAYERTPSSGREFGFHGVFNLVRLMPRAKFDDLVAGLEPGLLGRKEYRELLRYLLGRGRLGALWTLIKQRRIG